MSAIVDITERKLLEDKNRKFSEMLEQEVAERTAQLQSAQSALQAADGLKSAVLASSQHMVIATDTKGTVAVFNNAAEKALGYAADEVVGKQTPAIWHDLEEVTARAQALSKELGMEIAPGFDAFVKKAEIAGADSSEWTFVRKDQTRFPVNLTATCIRNGQGEITGYLGIAEDVAKRKKMEAERDQLMRKLVATNKELDDFAYAASHDLKAPLRVIDNASKWLEEDLNEHLNDETRENMGLLRGRVKRMERLLDDMLEYSHIGRDADKKSGEIVTGQQLMDNILGLLSPPEGFRVNVSPSLAGIHVNRMPLQQVLLNLINNAIKHHDKKTGCIEVSVEERGVYYAFAIKDDGPGIPAQFHKQIFQMFQTLKPRDQVEGSGMGLTMVRKPASRGRKTSHKLQERRTMPGTNKTNLRPLNIMLVEDDDGDAKAMQRAFTKAKIANPIVRAVDGIEALDLLRGTNGKIKLSSPYLLLVDLNMPRMNGIALVKALREDEALRHSIVFVLTTSKRDEDRTAAYDLNVAGYIVKAKAGEDFLGLVNLVDSYWRIVELP